MDKHSHCLHWWEADPGDSACCWCGDNPNVFDATAKPDEDCPAEMVGCAQIDGEAT